MQVILPKDLGLKICFWNLGNERFWEDSWVRTSWMDEFIVFTKRVNIYKEFLWMGVNGLVYLLRDPTFLLNVWSCCKSHWEHWERLGGKESSDTKHPGQSDCFCCSSCTAAIGGRRVPLEPNMAEETHLSQSENIPWWDNLITSSNFVLSL